jgi:protoporphyrinogen oxidase
LAGLYAAFLLSDGGIPVIVVEREFAPGGFLHGRRFHEHRYGPADSLLVTTDEPLARELETLLPPGSVGKGPPPPVHLRWGGRDVPLPLRLGDLLGGLPPGLRSTLVLSQLASRFRPGRGAIPLPCDAAGALRLRYGSPLFELILQPDLETCWGLALSELSADVADFPLRQLFMNPSAGDAIWTVQCPPETVAARLVDAIRSRGGRVFLGAEVEEVSMTPGGAGQIIIRDRLIPKKDLRNRTTLGAKRILSTIPLRSLLRALRTQVPAQIHAASYHLETLPFQAHAVLVQRPVCLPHPTLLFRQRPFLRLTEPRRLHSTTTDTPQTSQSLMIIELPGRAAQTSRETWRRIEDALEEEGICAPEEMVESRFLHWPEGHPLLRRQVVPALEQIFGWLDRYPDLQIAGASGRFACLSPTESMISARTAARTIADRSRRPRPSSRQAWICNGAGSPKR